MYIVRLDNNKIFDQRIDELTLIEPVIQLEENSAGSFTFIISSNHPYYDSIQRRKSIIQVFEDDDLLFSGMVYEVTEDFYKNRKIYCEGELSYLNDTIQRPAEYHNMTTRALLETYINNHNAQVEVEKQFRLGIVTVRNSTDSIYCYTNMETTLKCIKEDLVDDLGGIIRIRHDNGVKYIDYITENETHTNTQPIMLGENLINYKSNISSLDIATAIIPLGNKLEESPIEALDMRLDIKTVNDGYDYVYDSGSVNTFGWIYKTVIWDNVTDAKILKQKGTQYLNDTQFDNLVIEVNAVDMHLIDKDERAFRLSDKIRIVSKPHGLSNKYFRLTKQTINLNNPENNAITLGKEEQISLSARTVQANNDVLKAMESVVSESTILKHAKENASALINANGENGYVVLHENKDGVVYEILIMDQPKLENASKIWRWNQSGFGYANSKNTDGTWKYGTAITMDGAIVADFITSGVMSGDLVRGGTIEIGGKGYGKYGTLKVKDSQDNDLITFDKDGMKLAAGQTISWSNISGTDNVASKDDIIDDFSGLNGTISSTQISDSAVTSAKIQAGAIGTDQLAANAVTAGKISVDSLSAISADIGSVTAGSIDGVTITGGTITQEASGQKVELSDGNISCYGDGNGGAIGLNSTDNEADFLVGAYKCHSYNSRGSSFVECYSYDIVERFDINSDIRIKENIELTENDISKHIIDGSNIYSFNLKREPDVLRYGVIAQEIIPVLEEIGINTDNVRLVHKSIDDLYRVEYEQFIPHLINYVKDLRSELNILQEKIIKLENNNQ